jgi:hypothetical protein
MRTARCYHAGRACTIAKMRAVVVPLVTALAAGCGAPPANGAPRANGAPPANGAPVIVARASCNAGPYTLWLDFDGAMIDHGAADDATASPPLSLLASSATAFPAFDSTVAAPGVARADVIASIVDRVRGKFAAYAVDVTTARPAAGTYSALLVGGTHDTIGAAAGEGGLAVEDCGNASDRNVAFVFAGELPPVNGGAVAVANIIAHEAGHGLGLMHTDDPSDLMYSVAAPQVTLAGQFMLAFGKGDYSSFSAGQPPQMRPCDVADPVDNGALLACNAGTRAPSGDTTPPTLTWNSPPPPSSSPQPVTLPLAVDVDASDDTGVVRVEVYKNLELVAVLTSPPYSATVGGAASGEFFVTVEAVDAAANRATITRAFALPAVDDLGAPPRDLATAATHPPTGAHGCSVAAHRDDGRSDGPPAVALLLLALASWLMWRLKVGGCRR